MSALNLIVNEQLQKEIKSREKKENKLAEKIERIEEDICKLVDDKRDIYQWILELDQIYKDLNEMSFAEGYKAGIKYGIGFANEIYKIRI